MFDAKQLLNVKDSQLSISRKISEMEQNSETVSIVYWQDVTHGLSNSITEWLLSQSAYSIITQSYFKGATWRQS